MNIQSISIVVPTKGCVNNCKFCVSRMHDSPYENCFDSMQIKKRLKFARNNGVNTCILTGTGEALQNKRYLSELNDIFYELDHPFPNVELQTSGVMLMESNDIINEETGLVEDDYPNIRLLKRLGVNTISLSVSNIFDSEDNLRVMGVPENLAFDLDDLCRFIKKNGFNLRLSLNMTKKYNYPSSVEILQRCQILGADQITFRKLYHTNGSSAQSVWVKENACEPYTFNRLSEYIAGRFSYDHGYVGGNGKPLYRLPFGPMVYSIMGMSTVVDNDCMSKEDVEKLKYVILRENGKLYCQWDDEGSLIF
jgi:hypothetical protein